MNIPQLLILLRFCFAPIILLLAYFYGDRATNFILILMYLGLFSDIFDGIIARKQNLSTEKLRRLDSQVDIVFWLSIVTATWMLKRELLADKTIGLAIILIGEGLCYLVSFIKFKKEPATHAILSKIWGITLIIAFTALLGFNKVGAYFYTCVILGIISHIDVLLILLILPKWTHDVPSSIQALKMRRGLEIKRNKLFNG
jgi:phosphatidylglycerophosphate synthase